MYLLLYDSGWDWISKDFVYFIYCLLSTLTNLVLFSLERKQDGMGFMFSKLLLNVWGDSGTNIEIIFVLYSE